MMMMMMIKWQKQIIGLLVVSVVVLLSYRQILRETTTRRGEISWTTGNDNGYNTNNNNNNNNNNRSFTFATTTTTTRPTTTTTTTARPTTTRRTYHKNESTTTVVSTIQLPPPHSPHHQVVRTNQIRSLTLLVELRGELGNHLFILANARRIKRLVEREIPGVQIHMIGQHQSRPKWIHGAKDLQTCFVHFQNFVVTGGIHDEQHDFGKVEKQQELWLSRQGNKNSSYLVDIKTREQINVVKSLLNQPQSLDHGNPHYYYSLPYLTARAFRLPSLVDAMEYQDLRQWFRFRVDDDVCCPTTLTNDDPNTIVFHIRNYASEMKRAEQREKFGLVELSPNETADLVFGNGGGRNNNKPLLRVPDIPTYTNLERVPPRPPGTNSSGIFKKRKKKKMVVIGRSASQLQPYVDALRSRAGWDVRLVQGQTGIQDFCLALSATKGLVGLRKSTFAVMAGYLGNATMVRWYKVSNQTISTNDTTPPSLLQRTLLNGHSRTTATTTVSEGGNHQGGQLPRHLELSKRQFWQEQYSRRERV